MIFNKDDNGSRELHAITGCFDAGNDFLSVQSDIEMETENVIGFIGRSVYERAEAAYYNEPKGSTATDGQLVMLVQRVIALFAVLRYHRGNLVTHSSTGRKVGVDVENEKLAWEWMIDRDDEAMQRKAYAALDILLRWLEDAQMQEWLDTPRRAELRALMVPSLVAVERYYYIDGSHRFFLILAPLLRDVQERDIRPLLKERYETILAEAHGDQTEPSMLLRQVQGAIVLRAMSEAVQRFSVKLLPEGVVRQFQASSQTKRASETASLAMIEAVSEQLEKRATRYLDDVKKEVGQLGNEYADYQLLPTNDPANKYFMT